MLNKVEYNQVLELVKEKVEENPYDKEMRDLLKKLEKEVSVKNNVDTEKIELAKFIADSFYDVGVLPTNDLSKLTEGDIKRAGNFFGLTLKFEEINKKFFKFINENDFSKYEEFEPYLHDFIKEIVILGDKIRETKVK